MGSINYPEGIKYVVLVGTIMIFITFIYCFRKNPEHTFPEDHSSVRWNYRITILKIILIIIGVFVGIVIVLGIISQLRSTYDIPREVMFLGLILVFMYIKRKAIKNFLRIGKE